MAIQLSDVPCNCMFPPFQCNVTNESFLPINQENGTVYVVTNQPGREPYPMMYWNSERIPLNDYVVNAVLNGDILTLTRLEGGVLNVDLGSLDTNNYVNGISLDGSTLRLNRLGLGDLTQDLGAVNSDTNNYVSGASLTDSTLTLTREGLGNIAVNLRQPNMGARFIFPIVTTGDTITLSLDNTLMYGNNFNTFWDIGLPTRITPNVFGRYLISAWVTFEYDGPTPGYAKLEIHTPTRTIAHLTIPAMTCVYNKMFVTGHAYINNISDYIQVEVANASAGDITITDGFVELSRLL